MGQSYEKRARERRKQQKRREKAARKQNKDPEEVKEVLPDSAWFAVPGEEPEQEEGEGTEGEGPAAGA